MIPDIKVRLLKILDDPHFSSRDMLLAKSSLERINELENQISTHWTEMAGRELLKEAKNEVISNQAANEIERFLKRHSDK